MISYISVCAVACKFYHVIAVITHSLGISFFLITFAVKFELLSDILLITYCLFSRTYCPLLCPFVNSVLIHVTACKLYVFIN